MTTPDPVEKRRLFTECLLNMTADNWRDVVASFSKLSAETGRDHAEQWKLALFRSGQVAGEEAMNVQLPLGLKNKKHESWNILYGWGMKDSRAALAWLAKAEAEGHETLNENYSAILAGAALNDPEAGLKLLAEIPAQRRKDSAQHIVWAVLDNAGADALDKVAHYASTLDVSDPNDAEFSADLFQQVTDKLLWKADRSRDVAQACEVVTKLTQLGGDPTQTTASALDQYRWYKMPAKLNILEAASTAPHDAELDLSRLASKVLNTMQGETDRTAVREWMNEHPASPLIPHLKKRVGESE